MTWHKTNNDLLGPAMLRLLCAVPGNLAAAALGFLTAIRSWCSMHETPGIPVEVLLSLGVLLRLTPHQIEAIRDAMVASGHMTPTPEGFDLADKSVIAPVTSGVRGRQRSANAERQARYRNAKRDEHGVTSNVTDGVTSNARNVTDNASNAEGDKSNVTGNAPPSQTLPPRTYTSTQNPPVAPRSGGDDPGTVDQSPGDEGQARIPGTESADEAKSRVRSADLDRVLAYWKTELHADSRVAVTDSRRKYVRGRLKSYSADDLCMAIDGAKLDPWTMGRDPRTNGRSFTDVTQIFSDKDFVGHIKRAENKARAADQDGADDIIVGGPPSRSALTGSDAASASHNRASALVAGLVGRPRPVAPVRPVATHTAGAWTPPTPEQLAEMQRKALADAEGLEEALEALENRAAANSSHAADLDEVGS